MKKHCHGCGRDLPADDFHVRRSRKDGRQSRCKECVRAYMRDRHRADPEVNRERVRQWVEVNPEKKAALRARSRLRPVSPS